MGSRIFSVNSITSKVNVIQYHPKVYSSMEPQNLTVAKRNLLFKGAIFRWTILNFGKVVELRSSILIWLCFWAFTVAAAVLKVVPPAARVAAREGTFFLGVLMGVGQFIYTSISVYFLQIYS